MAAKKFTTTLEAADTGAVRLVVPFNPSDEWGKKPRHYVRGTLNGVAFEGSLGARGGTYFYPVNKQLRAEAGVGAGERVTVTLEPKGDEARAAEEIPADLAKRLKGEAEARAFFEGLSPFYRGTWIKWIESAKKPETRADRVMKTVESLKAGKKQR